MKTVLITGGSGFIGSYIVKKLYEENKFNIVVLDNFSEQIHGNDYKKSYLYNQIKGKCKIIKGDVRNGADVEKALENVNYIIHLASETGTGQSMYEINRYTDVNIMGTSNLIHTIINKGLKIEKFILSSSRSVYGEGLYYCSKHGYVNPKSRLLKDMILGDYNVKCPICGENAKLEKTPESCELNTVSYYAYTKMAQEKMLETMCHAIEMPFTIFRYQNVYGVGQSLNNPYTGILSIFSKLLLQEKEINIFEDGYESRDFIHVSDVASITCNALENKNTDYKYINVGYGESISVIEVAKILKKLYDSNSNINISGDFRKGDIRHNVADMSVAQELCNFKPKYDFKTGMDEFVRWVISQNINSGLIIDDKFGNSIKEMENTGVLIKR